MDDILLLDNIRSVHNVGSIFRTATACGTKEIILFGITPSPIDRFGIIRNDFKKVSLGTENNIKWKAIDTFEELFEYTKDIPIISIEQTDNSIPYTEYKYPKKCIFTFGAERDGVSHKILEKSKDVVEIPLYGAKESLNVSVCVGIILFNRTNNK